MKKTTKLFIVTSLFFLFCSLVNAAGTDVIFVNGILNKKSEASTARDKLQKLNISHEIDANGVTYVLSHNQTEGALDLIQSFAQKLITEANFKQDRAFQIAYGITHGLNLVVEGFTHLDLWKIMSPDSDNVNQLILNENLDVIELKSKIKGTLTNNKNVLVISHSQGNLLVNRVYEELEDEGEPKISNIANLKVASPESSPSSKVVPKSDWITNDLDVIRFLNVGSFSYFDLDSAEPLFDKRDILDRLTNHGFTQTYLNSLGMNLGSSGHSFEDLKFAVISKIKSTADLLKQENPIAFFQATVDPDINTSVNIDASASHSTTGGEIVNYLYTIISPGGLITSNEIKLPQTIFTLEETGNWTISLVVEDEFGNQSEPVSHSITIVRGVDPPIAILETEVDPLISNIVKLDATGSYSPSGLEISSYQYKFTHNGNASKPDLFTVDEITNTSFNDSGVWTISLIVTDSEGKKSIAVTDKITISETENPIASFTAIIDSIDSSVVHLDATASMSPSGASIVSYDYSFSHSSSNKSPQSTENALSDTSFTDSGLWTIILTVEDSNGKTSLPFSITVNISLPTTAPIGLAKTFINQAGTLLGNGSIKEWIYNSQGNNLIAVSFSSTSSRSFNYVDSNTGVLTYYSYRRGTFKNVPLSGLEIAFFYYDDSKLKFGKVNLDGGEFKAPSELSDYSGYTLDASNFYTSSNNSGSNFIALRLTNNGTTSSYVIDAASGSISSSFPDNLIDHAVVNSSGNLIGFRRNSTTFLREFVEQNLSDGSIRVIKTYTSGVLLPETIDSNTIDEQNGYYITTINDSNNSQVRNIAGFSLTTGEIEFEFPLGLIDSRTLYYKSGNKFLGIERNGFYSDVLELEYIF